MGGRIDWVIEHCRLLQSIGRELEESQPFRGKTIGTGIHLEPKTVGLLLTLQRGGATVVATGNLGTTQPEAVDYLEARGVRVVGGLTTDRNEHEAHLRAVLAAQPDLLLDNGADLFLHYLDDPYPGLLGGTEETTSGRARLVPARTRLGVPVLVINDSPIKQFAENFHAVGQSVLESFLRITNRSTCGLAVAVFGYGPCGRGIAHNFQRAYSDVAVVEVDPVRRLEAHLDGFAVPDRAEALSGAELVVSATGVPGVIRQDDLQWLRDGVVLANAGHFPSEIAMDEIRAGASVSSVRRSGDGVETLILADGRHVHVLAGGLMVNLAGPRPLGNSIESMDLGFSLQVRCLEAVALGRVGAGSCVVPVPPWIDAGVAESFLALGGRRRWGLRSGEPGSGL